MGQFYLQDKRQYVGNDLLFWAKDGNGYTTDLRKAEVYTKEEAFKQNRMRETDIPWPKKYIDAKVRPAVDHQHVDIKEALKGCDEKLAPPYKPPREIFKCSHYGKFISEVESYSTCPHCDGSNHR